MAAKQIKKQQKRSISQVSRKATVKTTRKLPPKVAHEAVHKRIKRRVKLAVIPHRDNQYRPHLIRRYGLAAVLLLVLIGGVGFNFATRGSVLGEKSELTASGLLAYTNDQRNEKGEAPLEINPELTKAAELKVQNMFADQYWAHTSPQGTTPWHWFEKAGYNYSEAGENLAKNFTTDDSTVAAWMASPTHRANILNGDYRDAGFAIARGELDGKQTTLVVALYGTPIATSAVAGAETKTQPLTNAAASDASLDLMQRFELGIGQITPVAVTAVIILLVLANLALLAQAYRDKLPKDIRNSRWYKHHGIYKALGLASLAVVVVLTYGSVGQI